jgi:Ca2+-binding EF-hand superfamily protein
MAEATLTRIRAFVTRTRVRIQEYFHDFDKLRSGTVSQEQFRRCLAMTGLNDILSQGDFEALFAAFPSEKKGGYVNYPAFVSALTLPGGSAGGEGLGMSQLNNISGSDSTILEQILPAFAHEASTRGLILKAAFKDFDKHNTGVVSLAQFRRGVPFKFNEPQFGVLQRTYQDEQGNMRYLNFCADVAAAGAKSKAPDMPLTETEQVTIVKLGPPKVDYDTEGLLTELKKQVKQYRIRVEEPFRDYDRLRTGLVTPAQFMAGLGKIKLQKMTLSEQHLAMLSSKYAVADSQGVTKVAYSRFVDEMDSVFTEKNLEKNPTKCVKQDAGQYSTRAAVNDLKGSEAEQVEAVLNRIRTLVRTRRLFLKPFFQDFDRAVTGVYQTQACTRERFERVLALNGVQLTANEYALVEKKYEVIKAGNSTERINYVLFCADVDPSVETPTVTSQAPVHITKSRPTHTVGSVRDIIEDIQLHCYDKRLRLSEFLRDFDPLRGGMLPIEKFSSGLSIAGIILDEHSLTMLQQEFQSPKQPNAIQWMAFAERVDEIFTTKGLEANPTKEHQSAATLLEKRATEHMPKGADNEEVVHILNKIAENVRNRGVLLPPFFKDFDRHNTGRISATQFQQVLSRHGFPVNAAQVAKITLAYSDPRDPNVVNVRLFIKAVDSSEDTSRNKEAQKQQEAAEQAQLALTRSNLVLGAAKPEPDLELIIVRLRSHVARERVRVREFFSDADRMRKGVVPAVRFGPCVDNIGAKLSVEELAAVVAKYTRQIPNQESVADYIAFCNDVDPAGGIMGLEKSPTKSAPKVEQRSRFANAIESSTTTEAQRQVLDSTIAKLRAVVKSRRMMLQPFFSDFDKLRKERVTPSQFTAALDKMKLQLSTTETENLLACLKDERGDIDYAAFIKLVD